MAEQVPMVDYLVLADEPHLCARECTDCGARFFDRRNACASCGGTSFTGVDVPREGELRSFTIVHHAAAGVPVPFVAAVVDCGGTSVRGNVINTAPDPEHVSLGMRVRLATYSLGDKGGVGARGKRIDPPGRGRAARTLPRRPAGSLPRVLTGTRSAHGAWSVIGVGVGRVRRREPGVHARALAGLERRQYGGGDRLRGERRARKGAPSLLGDREVMHLLPGQQTAVAQTPHLVAYGLAIEAETFLDPFRVGLAFVDDRQHEQLAQRQPEVAVEPGGEIPARGAPHLVEQVRRHPEQRGRSRPGATGHDGEANPRR